MNTASAAVSVHGIGKRFGRFPALKGVDLHIAPGELLALLGPSGSGKTTLLRLIAGLEYPDEGVICFGNEDVTYAPASKRGVGFVFQQYALFKHMTVAQNVAFGLDVRKRSQRPKKSERAAKVEELLTLVELGGLGKRYPTQLSGGQRQRVALARALAVAPRILLLDEPFGALDATVRKTLRKELRRIHETTGVTTVFVTHDQEEALDLADRVALLNNGQIEQIGSPKDLLDRPTSAFVAAFVGQANRLEGEVREGRFTAPAATLAASNTAAGPAVAFIRPDQFAVVSEGGAQVRLVRIAERGPIAWLDVEAADGQALEVALPRSEAVAVGLPGETLRIAAQGGHVFAAP